MDENKKQCGEKAQENKSRPYSKPQVTVHGSLTEITQKVGTSTADGITGSGIA
ncbi:MAG: hypothetical protein DMG31_00835 [Acidobacteria bacterium]|nr:MAG: hypothetical protein DMG31_00835 [Acidobacteriota bacterium]